MDKVIVYRRQLFKPSEIFIENQVREFKKFEPIFVGRKLFSSPSSTIRYIQPQNQNTFSTLKDVLCLNQDDYIKELLKYKPKLIHAHFGVDGVYALDIARKMEIPLVVTFHGFDATVKNFALLFSKKPAWINYLLYRKKLSQKGDIFIAVSNFIRDKIISLGFPKEKIITNYMGIDTNITLKKEQKNGKTILHVARLVEKKGTFYLIKAFVKVLLKEPKAKLIIIGDGELKKSLISLTKELNLQNNITFLGVLRNNEVLSYMDNSDIFCLPSITSRNGDSEGLGMVLLEAGIRGLPIVATNHGGIIEVIKSDFNGYLVPEKNEDVLAEKLINLIQNKNIREEFGKNSIKFIKENFDLKTQSAKLEEIYKSLNEK